MGPQMNHNHVRRAPQDWLPETRAPTELAPTQQVQPHCHTLSSMSPTREPPSGSMTSHRQLRRCSPVSTTRRPGWSSSPHLILLFSYSTLCAFTLLITSNELLTSQATGHLRPLVHPVEASQTPRPQSQASTLTTSSSSNSNNLYQALSQMYQVFNGNDSQTLDGTHLKVFELSDEDTLLVGSRNVVYNLSLTTLREQRPHLIWRPTDEAYSLCKLKGKSLEKCQNYIMVIKKVAANTLLICGTNAYSPKCRHYAVEDNTYELVGEMPGEGVCPYHEGSPFTATFTDGQLYSATAVGFTGVDYLIHRPPLRTEQYNPKTLNAPHFVSSFRYGDHVYFLFREVATEHINCGKTIYSRVARVCANDAGGTATWNRERWTSFAKVRLNCSIPGEFPFYFDEIQASTRVLQSAYLPWSPGGQHQQPSSGNNNNSSSNSNSNSNSYMDLIYAVFTTPPNSIGGSAICAYRMADILAAFEGPFKAQLEGGNSNWLPVPEARVPQPRPGACSLDSKRMSEESINFMRDNPLMDTAVAPLWSQPLITMASISFRFTQIAVDVKVETSQVYGASSLRTDVIFVSTDDGRVLKLMNSYHLMSSNQVHKVLTSSTSAYTRPPPPPPPPPMPAASAPLAQQQPVASSLLGGGGRPATAQVFAGPSRQFPDTLPDVSANTVIIEELHLFDQRTPITGLLIHRPRNSATLAGEQNAGGKLIVMSNRQIKAVPLSRCERANTCTGCLGLYDPYCVWDLQQQACLSVGRSASAAPASAVSLQDFRQGSPRMAWASPNPYQTTLGAVNNHTLAWWSSSSFCPAPANSEQLDFQQFQQAGGNYQQVSFPYRSMFSSHLQVPSRFDYVSGHHLSRTSLVALPQVSLLGSSGGPATKPASECLTMCGGVYGAPVLAPTAASQSASESQSTYNQYLSCADYMASGSNWQPSLIGYIGANPNQSQPPPTQMQHLYTSENLKWAVIICALIGLTLGLAFGFVLGKSSRAKNGDSICSSTFDETNLYMASTGSHGCHTTASGLFAPLNHHHQHHHSAFGQPNPTMARQTTHPAFMGSQQRQPMAPVANGLLMSSANNYSAGLQAGRSGAPPAFETAAASQSLLGIGSDHSSGIGSSTYANGDQHHFHGKQQQQQQHERSASVRTGALPPIPRAQPLALANPGQITHLNKAQLTPNSSTGGSQKTSTNGSSASQQSAGSQSTLQTSDQQYYHSIAGTLNGASQNQMHQRSFTSNNSNGGGQVAKPAVSNSTFLQQSQQQQQQQQQPNNKIFL